MRSARAVSTAVGCGLRRACCHIRDKPIQGRRGGNTAQGGAHPRPARTRADKRPPWFGPLPRLSEPRAPARRRPWPCDEPTATEAETADTAPARSASPAPRSRPWAMSRCLLPPVTSLATETRRARRTIDASSGRCARAKVPIPWGR